MILYQPRSNIFGWQVRYENQYWKPANRHFRPFHPKLWIWCHPEMLQVTDCEIWNARILRLLPFCKFLLGKHAHTKTVDFFEFFQTGVDPPPYFGNYLAFSPKNAPNNTPKMHRGEKWVILNCCIGSLPIPCVMIKWIIWESLMMGPVQKTVKKPWLESGLWCWAWLGFPLSHH